MPHTLVAQLARHLQFMQWATLQGMLLDLNLYPCEVMGLIFTMIGVIIRIQCWIEVIIEKV